MEKCFNVAGSCRPLDGKQVCADKSARRCGLLPPPVGTSDWARFSASAHRQIDAREYTTEMLADFAAHGEKRDILKFGMAFYKKNLVVCRNLS